MSSFIRVRDKKTGKIVEIPIAKVGKSTYEIALIVVEIPYMIRFLTPVSGSGVGITYWDGENNIFDTSQLNSMYKNLAYTHFCCYPAGSNENIIVTEVA